MRGLGSGQFTKMTTMDFFLLLAVFVLRSLLKNIGSYVVLRYAMHKGSSASNELPTASFLLRLGSSGTPLPTYQKVVGSCVASQ